MNTALPSSIESMNECASILDLKKLMIKGSYSAFINGKGFVNGKGGAPGLVVYSPIDNGELARFDALAPEALQSSVEAAHLAFKKWRVMPAPHRGKLVACIASIVEKKKDSLAQVITLEVGKTKQEALGEVQEWIDICEFAVGLSRQLYGLTIATERPDHRMMEQWQPLGVVGVISAFNFPMAVWAWNAMLAFVCGDPVIWKPSEKTPLCALACQRVVMEALDQMNSFPPEVHKGLSQILVGDKSISEEMALHPSIALLSATGSVSMGRAVAQKVAGRLGRCLLELGGNNAMIITPSANMDLAVRATVFSAIGTSGQRCTSLRRLIVHDSVVDAFILRVKRAFQAVSIGDPRLDQTVMGPLINASAFDDMREALIRAKAQGASIILPPNIHDTGVPSGGVYCSPSIVRIGKEANVLQSETFAPLLYVIDYALIEEAIDIQNNVPQGLSSAIFTDSVFEAELFLSAAGSDCGIANVNIGTSGAEIGGAFGGEKETGGGRESGSDAWKNYMRRASNTVNYGNDLPLAQGIRFT